MTLLDKQFLFARYLGQLLRYAANISIPITLGECWRAPQQAEWNFQHGRGTRTSLHMSRLAVDLQCFRLQEDGSLLWLDQGTEPEYCQLGTYWKTLAPDCCWGGDFTAPDYDHFSITHDGHK